MFWHINLKISLTHSTCLLWLTAISQLLFCQILKVLWEKKKREGRELAEGGYRFNAELTKSRPRRWNPSSSEFGKTASAKMYEEKILFTPHRQHCLAGEAVGQALTWTTSLQNILRLQLLQRHMALQMGPDNLPGYPPPGRVPFCKCRKETSQVPSCRLYDCGTGAEAMCPASLLVSPYAPGWGTRNCKDQQDIWFSTWITLKSQAPVWFWLRFCLMRWELTKGMGALDTSWKEKSLAELTPNPLCLVRREDMAQCSRELPCLLRAEVKGESLCSNRFS